MYVTLKNGKQLHIPTDEEDAAITAAAMSDPDAMPLTDEEWERVKPFVRIGAHPASRPTVHAQRSKVTLHIESGILAHLRATGKGWKNRVNSLLCEAVEQGRI